MFTQEQEITNVHSMFPLILFTISGLLMPKLVRFQLLLLFAHSIAR